MELKRINHTDTISIMENKAIKLIQGDKFTLVKLSGRAIAVKVEYIIKQVFSDVRYFVTEIKSGNNSTLDIDVDNDLIFAGWEIPLTVECETNHFLACGCYIFISNKPVHLRKYIELYNLNKGFKNKALIVYVDKERNYSLLYPNLESKNHIIESLKRHSL